MEDLFSTTLNVNNKSVDYKVVFDNEQYVFTNDSDTGTEYSNFSFKRENDEWHEQQQLPETIKEEAIKSLEKFLLSQH